MTKHKSSHTHQVIYFSYVYKKEVEGNYLPQEENENVRASYQNSKLRLKTSQ